MITGITASVPWHPKSTDELLLRYTVESGFQSYIQLLIDAYGDSLVLGENAEYSQSGMFEPITGGSLVGSATVTYVHPNINVSSVDSSFQTSINDITLFGEPQPNTRQADIVVQHSLVDPAKQPIVTAIKFGSYNFPLSEEFPFSDLLGWYSSGDYASIQSLYSDGNPTVVEVYGYFNEQVIGSNVLRFDTSSTNVILDSDMTDYWIDWGDGTSGTSMSHGYSTPGTHTVTIRYNLMSSFDFGSTQLVNIHEWGLNQITIFEGKFTDQVNLISATLYVGEASTTRNMFLRCTSLVSVELTSSSKLRNVSGTFTNCTKLENVQISDTSFVNDFNSMFFNCQSLLVAPTLDTSAATLMNQMFGSCTKLGVVPDYNTSGVSNFSSMFNNCSALSTIPAFDTSNATNVSSMFSGTSITEFPNYNLSKATNISRFVASTKISTIGDLSFPAAISASSVFNNCALLQHVGNIDLPNVEYTTTNFMFLGCTSLVSVGNISIPKASGGIFGWFSQCTSIGDINTPTVTSLNDELLSASGLKTVGTFTFTGGVGSGGLKTIIGNPTVESILALEFPNGSQFQIQPTSSSLAGLKHIGRVSLPGYSSISGLFQYHTSLESVDLIQVPAEADMGFLFRGCTALRQVPDMDYSGNSDHSQIFTQCSSLTQVTIPEAKNPYRWDSAFYDCSSLQSLNITFIEPSSSYESLTNSLIVDRCVSLQELILTGYDRGFNISDTLLTKDAIVVLFQSLGTVPSDKPAQRIFLTSAQLNSLTASEQQIATDKRFALFAT